MNADKLMQALRLGAEANAAKLPKGATAAQIQAAQRASGVEFPAQFSQLLSLTNGAPVGPSWLLGLETGVPHTELTDVWQRDPVWRQRGWIPLTTDGCGNYYVALAGIAKGPVAFIDVHEDRNRLGYLVASDITHFICFLVQDELEAPSEWPFDRALVIAEDPDLLKLEGVARFGWDVD